MSPVQIYFFIGLLAAVYLYVDCLTGENAKATADYPDFVRVLAAVIIALAGAFFWPLLIGRPFFWLARRFNKKGQPGTGDR